MIWIKVDVNFLVFRDKRSGHRELMWIFVVNIKLENKMNNFDMGVG